MPIFAIWRRLRIRDSRLTSCGVLVGERNYSKGNGLAPELQRLGDGGTAFDARTLRDAEARDVDTVDRPSTAEGGASPCSTSHIFCEDFESSLSAWEVKQDPGTFITKSSARARSGEGALELRKVISGRGGTAYLSRSVAAPRIRCEADYWFEAQPLFGDFFTMIAEQPAPFAFFQSSIARGADDSVYGGVYSRGPEAFEKGSPLAATLTKGVWLHLASVLNRRTFDKTWDGQDARFSASFAPANPVGWILQVGVTYEQSASDWRIFVDNVFCDAI
jgi:hypothetical protein